mgnify:CR=1 FL=1
MKLTLTVVFIILGLLTTVYYSGRINPKQYYDSYNILLDCIVGTEYTDNSIISKTKQGYTIIYKFVTSTKSERMELAKKITGYEIMINRDDNAKISEKEFLVNLNNPKELNL